jgi:hypothetical protein
VVAGAIKHVLNSIKSDQERGINMGFTISNKIRQIVDEQIDRKIKDILTSSIKELDPEKSYIMILPTDMPVKEVQDALVPFQGQLNLAVLFTDEVKLLELK